MTTSRRFPRTVLIALLALLFGVVTACSSPAEDEGNHQVSIDLLGGQTASIEVPKNPTRVISLLNNWTATLAALDVPITAEFVQQGYGGPNNKFAWTPEHQSEVVVTAADTMPTVDDIARFDPDLIIAGQTLDKDLLDGYTKLAPTITVLNKNGPVDTWQDIATATGKIFGKESQAADLVTKTQRNIDSFKSEHAGAQGKTFTYALFQSTGGFGAINSVKDPAAALLTELGFTLNTQLAAQHDGSTTRSRLSPERIDLLDSDMLLAYTLGDPAALNRIPGYNTLTAVRNGTVVYLNNDTSPAFGVPSAPSVDYVTQTLGQVASKF